MSRSTLPATLESVCIKLPADVLALIDNIQDRSGLALYGPMHRARIQFKNGRVMSVITGSGAYGYEEGLFEIAIGTVEGGFTPEAFDAEDANGDDVLGHCSTERVLYYIGKVARLPPCNAN